MAIRYGKKTKETVVEYLCRRGKLKLMCGHIGTLRGETMRTGSCILDCYRINRIGDDGIRMRQAFLVGTDHKKMRETKSKRISESKKDGIRLGR